MMKVQNSTQQLIERNFLIEMDKVKKKSLENFSQALTEAMAINSIKMHL